MSHLCLPLLKTEANKSFEEKIFKIFSCVITPDNTGYDTILKNSLYTGSDQLFGNKHQFNYIFGIIYIRK